MLYYFHRALYKSGYFNKINSTLHVKRHGINFSVPVINGMGYYHLFAQESWLPQIVEKLLSLTNDAFIDVGMNIGQTMLSFYGLNKTNAYIGFEPNPACVFYCNKLASINHFANCHIFPVGLSDKKELLTLNMDMDYASGASMINNFRTNTARYNKSINVSVFTGDEILQQNNFIPGIIKIDAEGAELEILLGLGNSIAQHLPYCIVEILPVYNTDSENGAFRKKREQEVLKFFFQNKYKLYRVNEKEISLLPLEDIEVHGNMNTTNYVFVHESKAEKMLRLFN